MNLNSLLFSQSACKHLQHKSASYIYLYLPPSLNFSSIAWFHPRTHFFGLSTLPSQSFPSSATINCNPTYSHLPVFSAFVSFAPQLQLYYCSHVDLLISLFYYTLVVFGTFELTWWLAFRSCATPSYFRFCIPPVSELRVTYPAFLPTFPSTRVPYARYVYYSTGLTLLESSMKYNLSTALVMFSSFT